MGIDGNARRRNAIAGSGRSINTDLSPALREVFFILERSYFDAGRFGGYFPGAGRKTDEDRNGLTLPQDGFIGESNATV